PAGGGLLSISGNLTSLTRSGRTVELSYQSDARCIASFSHRPYTLILDRKELNVEPLSGNRRFSVILPPGNHDLVVVLESTVTYGVDLTSFWSSWVIVAFGIVSCTTLLICYTLVRFSKKTTVEA